MDEDDVEVGVIVEQFEEEEDVREGVLVVWWGCQLLKWSCLLCVDEVCE